MKKKQLENEKSRRYRHYFATMAFPYSGREPPDPGPGRGLSYRQAASGQGPRMEARGPIVSPDDMRFRPMVPRGTWSPPEVNDEEPGEQGSGKWS